MRLSEREVAGILKGLDEAISEHHAYEVYLFGSRTDDRKRGGDIDLLLLVGENSIDELRGLKHRIVALAKTYIDDQKVDVTILSIEKSASDPFYQSIAADLIRLK